MGRPVKAAFVSFGETGEPPVVILFQYNPEMLTRSYGPSLGPASAGSPRETISFTMSLDAIDLGADADPAGDPRGVLPTLTALEGLVEGSEALRSPATLFVWGPHRLVAVQLTGLVIRETAFNETLAPMRAEVDVVMRVVDELRPDLPDAVREAWQKRRAERQHLGANRPGPIPDYLDRILG